MDFYTLNQDFSVTKAIKMRTFYTSLDQVKTKQIRLIWHHEYEQKRKEKYYILYIF